MSGVFISYRHEGGLDTAQYLAYRLEQEGYKVFFDKTSMRTGPFDKQLFKKIDECSDFIVILDPNVFKRTIENGLKIKENDWLAKEIAYARKKRKHIIPVELSGYSKPEKEKLPEEIRDILLYHNLTYSTLHFEKSFYSELTESLETPNPIKSKASKSIFPILVLVFVGFMSSKISITYFANKNPSPSIPIETIHTNDTTPILVIMGGGSVWNYINKITKFDSKPIDSLHNYRYIPVGGIKVAHI